MSLFILGSCSNGEQVPQPSKDYYVSVVKELSSEKYYGRSNYNNGAIKAAEFVLGEIDALGVKPIPQSVIEKACEGKQRQSFTLYNLSSRASFHHQIRQDGAMALQNNSHIFNTSNIL